MKRKIVKSFLKFLVRPANFGKSAVKLALLLVLADCTTNISPMDETQIPPSAAFGQFTPVLLKHISNQTPQDFSAEAATRVENRFRVCLSKILGPIVPYSEDVARANPTALVLEPVILDGKKVSVGARIAFGAFAGSSAVQMQVTYRSAKDGSVLAQPVFYAKAAAMSGAWTFGAQDNAKLERLSENACQYTATYKAAAR